MLMPKDKNLLRFLETNKSTTLQQAATLFFNDNYKSASRRLKNLEKYGYLKSYYINDYYKQKAYYTLRQLSNHELICLDIYAKLFKLGANILEFKTQFQDNNGLSFLKGAIKPDAYFKFNYNKSKDEPNNEFYEFFLEVDLNHYTDNFKMVFYEKLNREEFNNDMPTILILRPTTGITYNSDKIDVIYEDIDISIDALEQLFPNS